MANEDIEVPGMEISNDDVQRIEPLAPISEAAPEIHASLEDATVQEPIITDESLSASESIPEPVLSPESQDNHSEQKEPDLTSPPSVNLYRKHLVSNPYSTKVARWDPDAVTISLPSNLEKETTEIFEKLPNVDLSGSEEVANWGDTLSEGMSNIADLNQFVDALNNPTSNFRQSVDYKGKSLGITEIKTNFNSNHLTGEKAILAFSKALGIGGLVQTPLWSSGIWVTFKTPTEADMIRLNQEISEDKIMQGRATRGLAFSNSMAYTTERLARFAIDHIFDTTLQASALENKDIRELIKSQDYPTLIWGLICSMYPRGFQFRRACINDPEKCNHVVEDILNPRWLLWVNFNALTESHMVHMAQRQHKIKTLESVLNYQNTLSVISDKTVALGNDETGIIQITLKSPSLSEYVTAGQDWISSIVKIIDTIVNKNPLDGAAPDLVAINKERNRLIERYSQASSLRQISHWIRSIEMNDFIVEDTDTMANVLTLMSQDDSRRTGLIEEVSRYIEESTLSVIGIPVYDCPKCKMTQATEEVENTEYKNIIPLDVVSIFFDQHVQRMMRIGQR